MDRPRNKLLLTGPPGCGKTTVIGRVVERMKDRRLAGFYTREIREHGERIGFEVIGLGGRSAMLAHVDFHGGDRVGRYGVDVSGFEAILEQELGQVGKEADVFIIDEIGKMECLSAIFVQAVTRVLDGPVSVLATVAAKGGGFIARVKARPDVETVTVTTANRDRLPDELARRVDAS
jgi:nucleoside-triphosphatase